MDPQGDFLQALLIKNAEILIGLVITFNTLAIWKEKHIETG